MVWFWTDRLATVGSQTCGNLLSDIASGKKPCCQGCNNSVFDSSDSYQNMDTHNFDNMFLFNPGASSLNSNSSLGDFDLPLPGTGLDPNSILNADLISGPSTYNPLLALLIMGMNYQGNNNNGNPVTNQAYNSNLRYWGLGQSPCAKNLVSYANNFVGRVNSDSEGNQIFSNGAQRPWCSDFVTYCVRNVYGQNTPSWFGSSSVYTLMDKARSNGAYMELPTSGKSEFIANNIKPGDIMIQLNSDDAGAHGHTGIVKEVHSDRTFTVVEGNSGRVGGGQVKHVPYSANNPKLKGFVRV